MSKILIVDDWIDNIQSIVSYFEKAQSGYLLYQATSAKIALRIANQILPDLVITDWDMPEMNGIELVKLLRQEKQTKDIPIIIQTGVMLTSEDLRTAFDAGAIDYIRKPVDPVELIARTRSVLMIANYHKQILDLKNKELAESALYLIKNNEFNIQIIEKLQKFIHDDKIEENKLNSLITEIINEIDSKVKEDSWQRFNISFQSVYSDFYKTLFEKFPNLTSAEIKLCSFLKLGMNTKDISSVLHLSPESIKVSRSRLRKKLGLDTEQNLQIFLSSI